MILGSFQFGAVKNQPIIGILTQDLLGAHALIYLGYTLSGGLAGFWHTRNFLRNCQPVSQGAPLFWVPDSGLWGLCPHPCLHCHCEQTVLSLLLGRWGRRQSLVIAASQFFICLVAIWISVGSFAHFLLSCFSHIKLSVFMYSSFESLGRDTQYHIRGLTQYEFLLLWLVRFVSYLENLCLLFGHKDIFLFLSRNFVVLAFILQSQITFCVWREFFHVYTNCSDNLIFFHLYSKHIEITNKIMNFPTLL